MKMYAVVDKHDKKHYFDLKSVAKTFRDSGECAPKAHVTWGPDHPKHHSNRSAPTWNKGRHPKASWRTKGNKRHLLQKTYA